MTVKHNKSFPRGHWQVQEAKARFSELFRTARAEGPQRVSLHGKNVVVVLAEEDFLKIQHKNRHRGSLVDFFARSPLAKTKIELGRNKDTDRPVHL
jgi:antitoxin Phd